ncbi:MAG: adenylate kinase, partial [Candidatus Omnitrophota bacterium]
MGNMFTRRIVSIAMALCLVTNGIVTAYGDIVVSVRDACLGPELVFGKAIGVDPYNHKFAALAMIGLQGELHKLDGRTHAINDVSDLDAIRKVISSSKRSTYKSWNEATENDPAEVKCYFRDIQHVAGSVFSVPVHVKKSGSGARQNYLLAFSTKKDANGGFPAAVCTEDQLREVQEGAQESGAIFSSAEKGLSAVERYRQHERFDKNVIEWAHKQDLAVEIDAQEHIDAILKEADITVENKDKLTQNRKFYVISYRPGDACEKRIKGNKITAVDKDGKSREVPAYAHSSAYATYVFLPEGASDTVLRERLAHEVGVMFGCPVESFDGDLPVNEIDVRYSATKERGINLVLLGPNGAGKGTLAIVLAETYGLLHVSTGDMLRAAVEEGSEIGLEAQRYMDAGELVPDPIVESVLIDRIIKLDAARSVMFDGYPRTRSQAESLDNELKKRGRSLDAILYFETTEEVIVQRLSGRLVCRECGNIHHISGATAPKEAGICDSCGGKLFQRDDDKPATVKKRLSVYREKIAGLLEYYRKEGLLRGVNGDLPVEERFDAVAAIFRQEGLGRSSAKSFTVIDLDENLLTRDYAAGRSHERDKGMFEAHYSEL